MVGYFTPGAVACGGSGGKDLLGIVARVSSVNRMATVCGTVAAIDYEAVGSERAEREEYALQARMEEVVDSLTSSSLVRDVLQAGGWKISQ